MSARAKVRSWRRGVRLSAAVALSLAGVVTGISTSSAGAARAHAQTPLTALIYGPSVIGSDGPGTSGSLEQSILQLEGYTVTLVTANQWDAMTTAQFAAFRLLVIGDPRCDVSGMAAAANEATWMAAVSGNVIVIGTDPAYHYAYGSNSPGALATAQAGLNYAAGDANATNLYLDLSCAYESTFPAVTPPILAGLESGFSVIGAYDGGANTDIADVTSAGATALGVDAAQLSGWSASVHEYFSTWPGDFTPLAVVETSMSVPSVRSYAMTAHASSSSGSGSANTWCPNTVTSLTGIVGCPYIVGRNGASGRPRDLVATRTSTTLTVSWQPGGTSAPYQCTLLYGYGDPSTFTVRTSSTSCSFYYLDPATSYGVSVAGSGGTGPSSSVFAGPVRSTITCRRGAHVRHITGVNPRCPAGWRLVRTA